MEHTPNQIDFLEFSAASKDELVASRKFYEGVFGWSYQEWGDAYVDTQSSGLSSGIAASPEKSPPLPVIYSNDLEASLDKVTSSGGEIVQDIFAFPGGRRFHFKDPAGNQLAVWSDK